MQVINSVQETILHHFSQVADSGSFYLTGGTALAHFYLKHRRSNDLDFFTAVEEVIEPFSHRLEDVLKKEGMAVQRRRGLHSFVELVVQQGKEVTIVQLAQDAAFRFEPPTTFPNYPGLYVDSLIDIASNKLLALFGRATLRDFIDVYVLVTRGHFLPQDLMEKAKTKDPGFDLYWLGVAFERIKTFSSDEPEMYLLAEPIPFEQLRTFFDDWRQRIAQELR